MQVDITGFECLKELFETYKDFGEIWKLCTFGTLVPEMHI
jgi:hypothetical protein